MQLVLDRFGRVVLPKVLRDDLGLVAGDRIEAEEHAGGVILRPVPDATIVREKEGLLVFCGKPNGDLRAAVAEHRRSRIDRVAARRKRP